MAPADVAMIVGFFVAATSCLCLLVIFIFTSIFYQVQLFPRHPHRARHDEREERPPNDDFDTSDDSLGHPSPVYLSPPRYASPSLDATLPGRVTPLHLPEPLFREHAGLFSTGQQSNADHDSESESETEAAETAETAETEAQAQAQAQATPARPAPNRAMTN